MSYLCIIVNPDDMSDLMSNLIPKEMSDLSLMSYSNSMSYLSSVRPIPINRPINRPIIIGNPPIKSAAILGQKWPNLTIKTAKFTWNLIRCQIEMANINYQYLNSNSKVD